MALPHTLRALLAAAVLPGFVCLPVYAADEYTPRPQKVFVEKPRIEDYADYNTFLVDIMEYRRQKRERAAAPAVAVADEALASVSGQATPDRTLYTINAPESLEDALARARQLPHPVYAEPERFGRTTSFSFPIPEMEGGDLSANEIAGSLADLETVNPKGFEDESAQKQAIGVLIRNPSNEDETAEKKASAGTDDAYQASYNLASRTVTDSDGKTYWVPIYIENEIGFTVIRVFNVSVERLRD